MSTARRSLLLLAAALGVPVAGCGTPTPCERAVSKVEFCGIDDAKLTPSGETCDENAACIAECILNAACGDIQNNVNVWDSGPLVACTERCNANAPSPRPPSPVDSSATR